MSACFVALGFDPVPGDPDALDQFARSVGRTAAELLSSAIAVRRLAEPGVLWQGEAADAYRAQVQLLPARLEEAADALRSGQQALTALTGQLRLSRHRAWSLEEAATAAQRRLPDPDAERDLLGVREQARALRRVVRCAAAEAERALQAAADAAPDEPGRLQRLAAGLVDGVQRMEQSVDRFVVRHAELITALADAAGVVATVAAFVPGGQVASMVLGAGSLAAHAAVAHYTDGSWTATALAAAGMATGGASRVAGELALQARVASGLPLTAKGGLPSMFRADLVMGVQEMHWRTVKLQFDFAGFAMTIAGIPSPRDREPAPQAGAAETRRRLRAPEPPRGRQPVEQPVEQSVRGAA